MISPKLRPNLKPGDSHLVVSDITEKMKAFDSAGRLLWERPCLARGQYGEAVWNIPNSDTPPGLYRVGVVYRDYENPDATPWHVRRSFGWYSFDLIDLEGQESNVGRAGIMLHGGGSACGWPGAWAEYQTLYPTYGCLRMYNRDLRDLVLPLVDKGAVYISVHQESR